MVRVAALIHRTEKRIEMVPWVLKESRGKWRIISKSSPCKAGSSLLKNRKHRALKVITKSSKHFSCLLV